MKKKTKIQKNISISTDLKNDMFKFGYPNERASQICEGALWQDLERWKESMKEAISGAKDNGTLRFTDVMVRAIKVLAEYKGPDNNPWVFWTRRTGKTAEELATLVARYKDEGEEMFKEGVQ